MTDESDAEVDKTPTPPVPVVPKFGPDALFESMARWIGIALIVAGMYYDLELEREVNNLVYVIGGVLAGVSSVLGKLKP